MSSPIGAIQFALHRFVARVVRDAATLTTNSRPVFGPESGPLGLEQFASILDKSEFDLIEVSEIVSFWMAP